MADLRNDIEKYLNGELSPAEMHALEKKALRDPFLSEALDGAGHISTEHFDADLKSLRASLDKRIQSDSSKVISIWVWPARIAAGLLLLALATFTIVKLTGNEREKDLALQQQQSPKEEASPPSAPAEDSVKDKIPSSQPGVEVEESKPIASSDARKTTATSAEERPTIAKGENPLVATAPADDRIEIAKELTRDETPALDSVNTLTTGIRLAQTEPAEGKAAGPEKKKEARSFTTRESEKLAKSDENEAPASRASGASSGFVNISKVIRGRVVSEDGIALPGVNVMIKGTNMGTVTDGSGNYQISFEENNPSLVFSFIGFTSTEKAADDKTELNVQLNEDISQLSEVVVVGYGAERKDETPETLELATPAGGRKAFKQYLENNLTYPELALTNNIEGRVTIQFTVESSGQLSDFKIIKGIGHGCDEEVIRLVKQGPKWAPTKRNNDTLTDRVKVRMRFSLPKK